MSETTEIKGQFGLGQSGGTGKKLNMFVLQMSDYLKPTLYNNRGLENQLKNLCYTAHDLCCGCNDPTKHLEYLFSEQKCHHTGDTTTTAGTNHGDDKEDAFDEGDLENLFSKDFDEEDSG